MDISALRKMRTTDFSAISKAIENISAPKNQKDSEDDRFWKLTQDKAGNGSAVIRFLSRTEGDELPWVKIIDHGFQGPTDRWYIEKSLVTIGQEDPVAQLNGELWNNGTEEGKEQARKQKRRTAYYANVLVISDPANPDNNGKVKLFKFGKKIMEKIMDKAKPTFADEKPVNVFDYWEGANFKLRMKKVDGFPNYDASVFDSPAPVADSDEEILAIAKQQYRLGEFLDPKNFKTYDELKKRLNWVLNVEGSKSTTAESDALPTSAAPQARSTPAPQARSVEAKTSQANFGDDGDDDFSVERFRKLAED